MTTADIYTLTDPRNQQIRYVGKTKSNRRGKRFNEHLSVNDTTHKVAWIKQLKTLGLKPVMDVVETVDESDWRETERYWIQFFRDIGCDLVNHTDGGDGVDGFSPSPEQRQRLSEGQKRRQANLTLDERRALTASAVLAHQERGHTLTDEMKQLISDRTRAAMSTPEMRQRLSDAHKGKPGVPLTDEAKAKISVANTGRKRTPEQIATLSEAHKGNKASDETRAKMRESQQARRAREAADKSS